MKDPIFVALLGAALFHIFEEYVYPGGFADALERILPRASHKFTPGFHVTVNGIFLLLCLCSVLIGKSNMVFSLSVFSLVFANALSHIRGTIVTKGYYPGVISSIVFYIPLAIYAYYSSLSTGELTWGEGLLSCFLGALYMASLMTYVLLFQRDK